MVLIRITGRNNSSVEEGVFLFPIRVGWQTVFEQNNRRFYIHITEGHELSEIEPGYRNQSGSKYSKIESTPSLAIMSLYQKLFSNSKTKFFGPYILKWDKNELLEASLEIRNLIVYVTSLGIESNINMIGAGVRYISSFIGEFKKKRALFVQAIKKDNCKITIYISENESIVVLRKTPDDA
ncbi:45766_t:CDS:2 [Gigaspora margarita]|uniref:45766_t:CDS:1 n=1 Tax=Gigaspora margarita TaxID=4874 RepID=A0ABN7VJS3_GIGMA|nr:45766_t:CDS:2 [Gigaspora margarita]